MSEMLDIFVKLQDTPIPIVLVVAGIIFLFLALSGGIYGKVQIPGHRQKWAGTLGAVLLLLGMVLSLPELLTGNDGTSLDITNDTDGPPTHTTDSATETGRLMSEEERLRQEANQRQDTQRRIEEDQERSAREQQAEQERILQEQERLRREEQEREEARFEQLRRENEAQRIQQEQNQLRVGADLFVSEFTLDPEVPIQGEPVQVRIGVYNRGSKPAGAFTVQWWAGKNFPRPEQEWRIDRMSARGGRILTFTYDGYPSWYGRLITRVVIDSTERTMDADLSNNVFETTIQVRKR